VILGLFALGLVAFGLALGACVDKTPPPLWPTPPPPPMATPIGLPERPATAAGGPSREAEQAPEASTGAANPAPGASLAEPEQGPEQPGALGPWQPGRANR
jgi:hypothetical protein